jgi:hypothetical protein
MFCPKCRAEYPKEIITCDRCNVPLVNYFTSSPPHLWVGFVFAAVFLTAEIVEALTYPAAFEIGTLVPFLAKVGAILTAVGGRLYWLSCVDRMHKILLEATDGQYSITPTRAGLYHFIPFYNLYWVIKWPNEIARFVNRRLPHKRMMIGVPGAILLVGALLRGALGLAVIFTVGVYLSRRVQAAVAAPVAPPSRDSLEVLVEDMFSRAIGLEQEGEWEKAIILYERIAENLQGYQDAEYAKNCARAVREKITLTGGS